MRREQGFMHFSRLCFADSKGLEKVDPLQVSARESVQGWLGNAKCRAFVIDIFANTWLYYEGTCNSEDGSSALNYQVRCQ